MASEHQVRQYLAYWFQLGKKVVIGNGQEILLPKPVFNGERYSSEFEECWQKITAPESGDCNLEGTDQTIAELLTSAWELVMCSRCTMPVPLPTQGMPPEACPCFDLPNWPNNEVPKPREAVNTQKQLNSIRGRLIRANSQANEDKKNSGDNSQLPNMEIPLNLPTCHCPQEPQESSMRS